jgi:putative permease
MIANAIDIALIFPILVSKIVDLHPVLVILSVILGSQLMGVTGMVVSIPIAASIKLIVEEVYLEFYQRS